MMKRLVPSVLWTVLPLVLIGASGGGGGGGCNEQADGPVNRDLPTTTMRIGSAKFTLEIAHTDSTRQTGLMNRRSMPQDHGMIFVFPSEQRLAFWMKDTYIALDLLYLDSRGRVVSIHALKPLDISSVPSVGPAKYAIELNSGSAARAGVKPGDALQIPPEARDSRD